MSRKERNRKSKPKHHEVDEPDDENALLKNLNLVLQSEAKSHFDWKRGIPKDDWDSSEPISVSQIPLVVHTEPEFQLDEDVSEDHLLLPDKNAKSHQRNRGVLKLMENVSTGQFHPWRPMQEVVKSRSHSKKRKLQLEVHEYEAMIGRLEVSLSSFWFFTQGLLAGFSVSPLFLFLSAVNLQGFLSDYSRVANDTRRLLFLLCSLSLIGSISLYHHARHPIQELTRMGEVDWLTWKQRPRTERLLSVIVIAVYSLVFLMTILCSIGDVFISYQNNVSQIEGLQTDDLWTTDAIENDFFMVRLRLWIAANIIRSIGAFGGWFLVCYLVYLKSSSASQNMFELQESTKELQRSMDELSGKASALQNLSVEQLEALVQQQSSALKSTEAALDSTRARSTARAGTVALL